MHPVLIEPFGFAIYSYSAVLILSFICSMALAIFLAKRQGPTDVEYVQNLALWGIIWGLIGGRLGYVLWDLPRFVNDPIRIFAVREGGMTILGGIIVPLIVLVITLKRRGIEPRNVLDTFSAPLLLGMAIGRIGCILHGCCYGSVCDDCAFGLTYSQGALPLGEPLGPRYPTQIFEMVGDLILMSLVIRILPHLKFAGQAIWITLAGYGCIRFTNEFFRDDRVWYGPLPIGQWIALGMITVGVLGLLGVFGRPPVDHRWQAGDSEEQASSKKKSKKK